MTVNVARMADVGHSWLSLPEVVDGCVQFVMPREVASRELMCRKRVQPGPVSLSCAEGRWSDGE